MQNPEFESRIDAAGLGDELRAEMDTLMKALGDSIEQVLNPFDDDYVLQRTHGTRVIPGLLEPLQFRVVEIPEPVLNDADRAAVASPGTGQRHVRCCFTDCCLRTAGACPGKRDDSAQTQQNDDLVAVQAGHNR